MEISREAGKKKSDRKFGPRSNGIDVLCKKTEDIHTSINKNGTFVGELASRISKKCNKKQCNSNMKTQAKHRSKKESQKEFGKEQTQKTNIWGSSKQGKKHSRSEEVSDEELPELRSSHRKIRKKVIFDNSA